LKKKDKTQVVLVDDKDKVIGYKEKFEAHKHTVSLHRAISVVVFDKDRRKMLIHKRAKTKATWPLFWTNACCTHPLKGESYKAAAERRLKEEMGFSTPLKQVFKFIYEAKFNETWGEHELDAVFVGNYSGEIKPDPEEVDSYKWVKIEKLLNDVKKNPDRYTPWFKIILEKLEKS
jgi:isopentenyl-diphosphate delta-isomerase